VQAGTIMAASDRFNITVLGRGGHAGLPHKARDPVVAAAALVGALQVCRSRKLQRAIQLTF
jgi:metal-dependent amidase/aminoacylase/carboxypeptidase family protein